MRCTMFRYIAIAWDASHPDASRTARDLGSSWHAEPDWEAALLGPGLQVFTTGTAAGINDVHPLPPDQGVVLGKLFRRSRLHELPTRNFVLSSKEATEILESEGRLLVTDFWGRYVAFLRSASGSNCVLRDPSGTLPCFRIEHGRVSIIFSWLEDALQLLGTAAPRAVNWGALTAQLLRAPLTGRETSLEGVFQVLPGERLDLQDGRSAVLWSAIGFARSAQTHDAADADHHLRRSVRSCTAAWASCYDTLLLRLSGGLDSSILLSCLASGSVRADVICINYHSPGSDSDERPYARLAAVRVGRDLIERERDLGFQIERVLQIARMPDPVPYIGWMNAGTDARLASAYGATAMFSGAGGDALFYEIPRWWPAGDYLRTNGVDAGFAAAAMDAARLGNVSVWHAIALALQERVRPSRALRELSGGARLVLPHVLHDKTLLQRFAHPALLDTDDLPIGKYMQVVALMSPLGYYDPFEQAQAPELVNPLLSQPLVELCLGLPTYVLTQGGRGRALARRAFSADLPAQITGRRSKGGMEEHIKAVLDSNIDVVRDMLLNGQLAGRGILDRPKVEELLSGRPTALAGPISQIHGLVAAEAWLSRWPR
jgi:asparagine synthase (glutamine-hydrolysing)